VWEELEFKNWKNGIQWRWVNGIPMQQGMVQHRTLTNIIMTNWFTNHDSHNPPFLFYFLFYFYFFTLLLSSCSYSSFIFYSYFLHPSSFLLFLLPLLFFIFIFYTLLLSSCSCSSFILFYYFLFFIFFSPLFFLLVPLSFF